MPDASDVLRSAVRLVRDERDLVIKDLMDRLNQANVRDVARQKGLL